MKKDEKLQLQIAIEEFCSISPNAKFHYKVAAKSRVDSYMDELILDCFTGLMDILKDTSANIDIQLTVNKALISLAVCDYNNNFDAGAAFHSDSFTNIRKKIAAYNEKATYKCKTNIDSNSDGNSTIEFRVITIDVYITEDMPVVADGFELFLTKEGFNVIGVSNTLDGCRQTLKSQKTKPDILLLDINMRRRHAINDDITVNKDDENGIVFCKELKTDYPEIKVIAYTFYREFTMVKRMLDNGASGYITKDSDPGEFINGIITVMTGEEFLSADVKVVMMRNKDKVTNGGQIKLTHREAEVLELIAEGFIIKEIAAKLGLAVSTVSTIAKNIKEKYNHFTFTKIVLLAMIEGAISLMDVEMKQLALSSLRYGNVILDEAEMNTLSDLISDYVVSVPEKEKSEKKQMLLSAIEKNKVSETEKQEILSVLEKTEERITEN
jgi:DNA-binding NarL/FixJ family response regulator